VADVYADIVRARLLSLASSPRLFVLRILGDAVLVSVETAAPLVLVHSFGSIAGWTGAQVAMLIGLGRAGEGIAFVFGRAIDATTFAETVRLGRFDNVLTRPVSPLGWLLTSELEIRFLSRTVVAVGIVAWSAHAAGVAATPANVALLAGSVLAVAVLVLCILVVGAAFTFVTVEGSDIANLFANGGIGLVSYPLDVYSRALRFVFTFVVPIGLCVYVPVVVVLGRRGAGGAGAGLLPMVPVVLAVVIALTAIGWRAGLRRYQSTGS
jgi:ABC-2 type transport system permease protein